MLPPGPVREVIVSVFIVRWSYLLWFLRPEDKSVDVLIQHLNKDDTQRNGIEIMTDWKTEH